MGRPDLLGLSMMDFSIFREIEQFIYFAKILAVVHGICIVIAVLPSIEIATRRIVIGIAAIAVVAFLVRFGYRFKNDDSVYLLYPIAVLIADVLFIVWPYLPRQPSSPYQQASQPMNSKVEQPSPHVPQQQPPQPFSDSGPIKGIVLRLKRGERVDRFSALLFTLDARIDVSAENRALIEKYKLGNRLIYESANREKYRAKARDRLDDSDHHASPFASPGQQAMGAAKSFWRLGQAAVNMAASALALKITVNSLMNGHHIECKDMTEILEAEEALKAARENLKAEIELATSFGGKEIVIDD